MELKNRTLSNFAELVRTGECKKFRGRLKVGVDLGTANTVLAVVDSTNRPIAGVSAPSHAIRDGVIVNYYESVQLVTKLKEELEDMGMFAPEYKQPIPSFIKTLGVVTAPTGAVIQDIRNVTARRNPYVQIILYPARVQGEDAAESIVEGIEALDQLGVDVIIVGRGGGSMEDLWAFNEEIVARAIFNCSTPIISAVGHETDVTIADYVADLRAPTPSAAAELAVFDYRGWQEVLAGYVRRLELSMDSRLEMTRQRLTEKAARLAYLSPENQIREKRMYLLRAEEKLTERMEKKLQMEKTRLYLYAERLRGVSPLEKLQQGLGYMEHEDGTRISSVNQVTVGERMKTYVKDGVIWSNVEKTEHSEEWNASRDKEPDNCE